ncbi:hypothetical protein [Amycolatopsis japonica]
MAVPKRAAEDTTIVVKGIFSPALFSPSWLLMQKLIGAAEFDAAEVQVIASEVASFRTGWLNIQVTADTFQASTALPDEFERLRDLAVGVLNTLTTAPVAALGINRNIHFEVGTAESWHAFGDSLTPKQFWDDFMLYPGMKSVSMLGGRGDLNSGYIQFTVEPSTIIKNGIFVAHNDHYALKAIDKPPQSRDDLQVEFRRKLDASLAKRELAVRILTDEWQSSAARSNRALMKIASKMEKSK